MHDIKYFFLREKKLEGTNYRKYYLKILIFKIQKNSHPYLR
jgi:hypothetical protein